MRVFPALHTPTHQQDAVTVNTFSNALLDLMRNTLHLSVSNKTHETRFALRRSSRWDLKNTLSRSESLKKWSFLTLRFLSRQEVRMRMMKIRLWPKWPISAIHGSDVTGRRGEKKNKKLKLDNKERTRKNSVTSATPGHTCQNNTSYPPGLLSE